MLKKPVILGIPIGDICLTLGIILGLYALTGGNFLFFHSMVEGVCMVVGALIYIVGTQTFKFSQDQYMRFLGYAYLFVAIFDGLHLLSFEGMGVFPNLGHNAATQAWLVARYYEALAFILVYYVIKHNIPKKIYAGILGGGTTLLMILILQGQTLPTFYISGVGQTMLKLGMEYLLILLLVYGILQLYRVKSTMDQTVFQVMVLALITTALAEFCFTLYVSTQDLAMVVGHILKLISYGFVFWGTILRGLDMPYNLIFKQLKIKNEHLEALNEKKNEFIGIAAHDLRNPLTIITMSSQVLSRSAGLDAKQLKFLERIRSSSEYMQHLVDDLLDYTKIEAGKLSLNLAPCAVAGIVENSVSLNQTLAVDKEITLAYSAEPEIPLLFLDAVKMEQVVNNLITNAIKYSYPRSTVQIKLKIVDEEVVLLVEDEGQGIPAYEIPLVFNPYVQTSVKTTAGEKSTGLGMAISRKIVEGHNGRIWVESVVGQGSRFYVALPLFLTLCAENSPPESEETRVMA